LAFIKPVKPYVLGKQFGLQCHYYPKARFVRLPLFNFSPKSGSFTTFFFMNKIHSLLIILVALVTVLHAESENKPE